MVWEGLGLGDSAGISVQEVRDFLEELRELRLVYEEDGRYLSLAIPANPEANVPPARESEPEWPAIRAELDRRHDHPGGRLPARLREREVPVRGGRVVLPRPVL